MGILYSSFKIRGPDVSHFNGVIDWSKIDGSFAAIRVGYGKTIDPQFLNNWKNARGKVKRIPYWYLDYYSNWKCMSYEPHSPMSDRAWGRKQAELCWSVLKNDPEGKVFLDVENGGASYSRPLTDPETREHAEAIARAFLERMDELNGKRNGIYCSVGFLSWFWSWFRDRDLWVAWYNENVSIEDVLYSVRKNGWDGKVLMWQYARDGDIDDDNIGDGVDLGTQYSYLDLNGWIGTEDDYSDLFGVPVVVVDPNQPPAPLVARYKITASSLRLRKAPNTKSKVYGVFYFEYPIVISEVIDGWGKVDSQEGYICLRDVKNVYAEKIS
jgi:GH25 family lysozyme M1 (1,4-beta-N-acetylmuramidase)